MTLRNEIQGRTAFFKSFVFLVASFVVAGWGLGLARGLNWLGLLAIPAFVIACLLFRKWSQGNLRTGVIEPMVFWPFILISILSLIRALAYPPIMLDSLTYRLPRILVWLQEGYIHHVQSPEDRLNYMPQVWELAAIPLLKLAGERLVWLWSFIAWIVLYLLAYGWALEQTNDAKKSRLLAFLGSASTYAVLQSGSTATDLFASVLALLAVYFVMTFERTRNWWEISWAALSLGLAAGAKPHFAVFGLPLVIWFLVSRSKPWKAFKWAWLPLLLPLWLLCSPAPAFFLNYRTYGSLCGPGQDYTMTGKGPGWNIVAGSTMIVWQSIQPPVNPLALVYNPRLDEAVQKSEIKRLVPRFQLVTPPVAMVDNAGLGLITSILFALGVALAIRKDRSVIFSWRGWAMVAGFAGVFLALSRFVSGGSGRAFCGFLYFGLPLAIIGWAWMRPRALTIALYATLLSCICALILNPSRRLWPADTVHDALAAAGSPKLRKLADLMQPYLMIPDRATTGVEIMQAIPDSEEKVLALVAMDRPLWPLFSASSVDRRFLFLRPHASPAELEKLGANYVVLGGPVESDYEQICSYLNESEQYQLVLSREYTSKLARGSEVWKLYRKVNASATAQLGQ